MSLETGTGKGVVKAVGGIRGTQPFLHVLLQLRDQGWCASKVQRCTGPRNVTFNRDEISIELCCVRVSRTVWEGGCRSSTLACASASR